MAAQHDGTPHRFPLPSSHSLSGDSFLEKRVAAGLKAAIHNPNVSEEARRSAQERLEQMGEHDAAAAAGRGHPTGTLDPQGHETNRVLGGYKATLHSTHPFLSLPFRFLLATERVG